MSGFHYSNQLMKKLAIKHDLSILELDPKNENLELYQHAIARHGEDFISSLNSSQLKELYPELTETNALLMPHASVIDPTHFVNKVFQASEAKYKQAEVASIEKEDNRWIVSFTNGESLGSETLIIASGHESPRLLDMIYPEKLVNLGSLRGQVAHFPASLLPQADNIPAIYGDKYLLKADDQYLLGATFHEDDPETELRESDFDDLLNSLKNMIPGTNLEAIKSELNGRCSFRGKSKDYLPVVGPLPKISFYKENYGGSKRTHAASRMDDAEYEGGLYIATAFGSRGFTTAPISARILVEEILNERYLINCDLRRHLHPARFLLRRLRRGE